MTLNNFKAIQIKWVIDRYSKERTLRSRNILLSLTLVLGISCNSSTINPYEGKNGEKPNTLKGDSLTISASVENSITLDQVHLASISVYEAPPHLSKIQNNLKRINSTQNWSKIIEKELWQSTEGGTVLYYFDEDSIQKVIVHELGETGQITTQFYLLNHQLSLVIEGNERYNRPITWDSTMMREMNDNQVHDRTKSEINTIQYYFKNDTLIHYVDDEDCGAPMASEYLQEEEARIKAQYLKIMSLLK